MYLIKVLLLLLKIKVGFHHVFKIISIHEITVYSNAICFAMKITENLKFLLFQKFAKLNNFEKLLIFLFGKINLERF